jgi:hypothetical protein
MTLCVPIVTGPRRDREGLPYPLLTPYDGPCALGFTPHSKSPPDAGGK